MTEKGIQILENARQIVIKNGYKFIKSYDRYIIFSDSEGYIYKRDYYKINTQGISTREKFTDNEYLMHNLKNCIDSKNPYNTIINYTTFTNLDSEIECVCGLCGKQIKLQVRSLISSEYKLCENCNTMARLQRKHKRRAEEIAVEVEQYGYRLIPPFNGRGNMIDIIDHDGYKGMVNIHNLKKGSQISLFAKYNKFALENLRHYCDINNIDCIIPDQKYDGWDFPITVICKCGKQYTPTVTHFIHDSQIQCVDCSKSKSNNEKLVENWLQSHNINYQMQYKINECKNVKPLPFDFYIENFGLIEIDGEGHEKPTRFNGINKSEAEALFIKTKFRDKIKDDFCKKHHIKLLRISYKDINNGNYQEILSSNLIH